VPLILFPVGYVLIWIAEEAIMPEKELSAKFGVHDIVVRNAWTITSDGEDKTRITLSIDGRVVDSTRRATMLGTRVPILRGTIHGNGKTYVVEVFARAILRVRVRLCVDGRKIAGDI
jgi:hypothetical protein